VPITPVDRAGAYIDSSPLAWPSPLKGRVGVHDFPFGLLRLHSRYGPTGCSIALQRPLSRGFDTVGYPAVPLVSYQTDRHPIWVDSASTGYPRLRGAPFRPNRRLHLFPSIGPVLLHELASCTLLFVLNNAFESPFIFDCPIVDILGVRHS
jgi:hypothetical protein